MEIEDGMGMQALAADWFSQSFGLNVHGTGWQLQFIPIHRNSLCHSSNNWLGLSCKRTQPTQPPLRPAQYWWS